MAVTSQIIIERVYLINDANVVGDIVQDIIISSQNQILLVGIAVQNGTLSNPSFNNNIIPTLVTATDIKPDNIAWYLLITPPVGQYALDIPQQVSNSGAIALVISGASKVSSNYKFATGSSEATNITTAITSSVANSLLIDLLMSSSNTNVIADKNQTPLMNQNVVPSFNGAIGVSYKISSNLANTMSWSFLTADANAHAIVAIPPAQQASIWYPNIGLRNINNVDLVGSLDILSVINPPVSNTWVSYGNFASTFYQTSFLHTVGRILGGIPLPAVTQPAGQIPTTSQIIIDKVYQGQVGGGATLSMDINIPSQDAVLVVTGGSVIATGGAWTAVQYNGTPLTKLVTAIVSGADAEIWYLPNPPVGTGTLTIVPTAVTGQVYANAMVLLGVDKRNFNIISNSTTDAAATSTITTSISPDAANSLIIDVLSTLDATAAPLPDSSQQQMFRATSINANEYVVSTYKLSTNNDEQMNYNLGAAVNASLVAVAFRPATAASMWFPNIDLRSVSDTVTSNALDSGTNPTFGNYGYKGSNFFLNSFLHTVGRQKFNPAGGILASTLLTMGVG